MDLFQDETKLNIMKRQLQIFNLFLIFQLTLFPFTNILCQINLDSSLVAYFPFNGNANDESTFGVDGIVNNASLATGILGDDNGAYFFNGIDAFIDCSAENRNVTNVLSISAFIKTNSSGVMDVINKYNWGEDKGYHLQINESFARVGGRDHSGSYYTTGHSISSVNDNEWHHLVAIINMNTWQIWVDCNMEIEINTSTNFPIFANTAHFSIGMDHYEGDQFFEGTIDEVRLYNRVLTDEEINSLCDFQSTKIDDLNQKTNFIKLYPNPATEILNIEFEEFNTSAFIEIVDSQGNVILSKEVISNREEIDLSNFHKGVYILVVRSEKLFITEKFTIF